MKLNFHSPVHRSPLGRAILMALAIACLTSVSSAAVILIDFGPTAPVDTNTWNNYGGYASTTISNLLTSTNTATGFSLSGLIAANGGGSGASGPTSGTTPAYPTSVTSDYIFNNVNTTGSFMTLTFGGLSAGTYSFTILSDRNSGGTRQTDFSIAGATTSTFSINSGTAAVATTVSGITRDGSNNIVIQFGNLGFASGGFASSNYNSGTYLNAIQIDYTAVPEPSVVALVALAGGLFVIHRRRSLMPTSA